MTSGSVAGAGGQRAEHHERVRAGGQASVRCRGGHRGCGFVDPLERLRDQQLPLPGPDSADVVGRDPNGGAPARPGVVGKPRAGRHEHHQWPMLLRARPPPGHRVAKGVDALDGAGVVHTHTQPHEGSLCTSLACPGPGLATAPGRVRRGRGVADRAPADEVRHGGDAEQAEPAAAVSPVRYDGGRSTSASGRSSAATRSAYPGSQVASSSARIRSSPGRSRRRAAAGRRREERHRQERQRQEGHREARPGEAGCREGNCRGRTGPDSRTPRCRRCASEVISTATTAMAITPGIIHSPPVPVQLGYARLNHATPGTLGKWFMTESAELFGAIRPTAKGRPPAADSRRPLRRYRAGLPAVVRLEPAAAATARFPIGRYHRIISSLIPFNH